MSRTTGIFAAIVASAFALTATASAADAALFNNRNVLSFGKEFAGKSGFSNFAKSADSMKLGLKTYSGGSLFATSSVLAGKADPAKAASFANATNGATTLSEGLKSRSLVTGSTTGK
ncbi:MAG: hypothetical protein IT548_06310 [Alphaproteobacteria bacterium]|nr:hypothetical protein [Alphaproteobacteria bacterium]